LHTKQIKVICFAAKGELKEAENTENKIQDNERFFSVELKSKAHLKNVTLTSDSSDSVLIEGTLGELVQATFAEGVILEVVGKKGTLRINLGEDEIKKAAEQSQTEVKEQ
jgi:hypothetical protein